MKGDMEYKSRKEYFEGIQEVREKPTVYCKLAYGEIVVGQSASVIPSNHPASYLNGNTVQTSTVISYDKEMGEFETRNTKYVLKFLIDCSYPRNSL